MAQHRNKNNNRTLPKPNNGPKEDVFLSNSNLPCKVLPKSNNPVISKFLNSTITIFNKTGDSNVVIKNIFNEKDFWFSDDHKKIVITSSGIKKLIATANVTFPKIIPLEKQCDGPSKEREQVWIEATAVFPDGSISSEYGIASKSNVDDEYEKTILPIVAKKRAIARALLNAPSVNLDDCIAAVELPKGDKSFNDSEGTSLKDSYSELEGLYKKLINSLCLELTTKEGLIIWNLNDPKMLLNLTSSDSYLVRYISKLKLERIVDKHKQ